MRTISADGLTLEPQVVAHASDMFAVLGDPAIYEYENEPPASLEWLRERFLRLETRRSSDGGEAWLNWVLRLPSSELIGFVQATVHPDGRADIAYTLASPHWGRGLAHSAVTAMMSELIEHCKVHALSATLKCANHRSLRLLARLGFAEATPETRAGRRVAADELLMIRDVQRAPPEVL